VGDYSIFIKKWADPQGGIHGYLHRFLESGDATFQHIAVWTLLQLLESRDRRLVERIAQAADVVRMVRAIADRAVDSEPEEELVAAAEEGEREVVELAKKCLELMNQSPPKSLVEG
jgi:vacuolar protein 8